MNDSIYLSIQNSPRFKELVRKRERFAWILSAIMLGLYSAFILLIAYGPQVLGAKLSPGSSITWGIPLGVGLIVSAFILTGIYVRRILPVDAGSLRSLLENRIVQVVEFAVGASYVDAGKNEGRHNQPDPDRNSPGNRGG